MIWRRYPDFIIFFVKRKTNIDICVIIVEIPKVPYHSNVNRLAASLVNKFKDVSVMKLLQKWIGKERKRKLNIKPL